MKSVTQTTLDILESSPDRQLNLVRLSRELQSQKALGFGVEAADVVRSLVSVGKVSYNKETNIVSLGRDNKRLQLHIKHELLEIVYKLHGLLPIVVPEDLEEADIKKHIEDINILLNKVLK